MKPHEAAAQLGMDRRTVSRHISRGILPARKVGRGYDVATVDVQTLKRRIDARQRLRGRIKELFVLRTYGTPFSHIQDEYGISSDDVDNAVFMYDHERGVYLSRFGVEDVSDFLLVREVAARLKVVDEHIPRHLQELGELEMHTVEWGGRPRFFPSKASFGDYLGPAVQTVFYNSRETAADLGITVESVDRIACSGRIGRKIKNGSKHSNYLFTPEDIEKIRHGNMGR